MLGLKWGRLYCDPAQSYVLLGSDQVHTGAFASTLCIRLYHMFGVMITQNTSSFCHTYG